MKNVFKKFESLDDFHRYISGKASQPAFDGSESSLRTGKEARKFSGTKDFEEAERLFLYGDGDSASKIEKGGVSRERRLVRLSENRRRLQCAVTGFAPHVPNYIAGVPTNMITARMVQQKTKVLNLVYNLSVNSDIDANEMRDVAVKMLSAIMRTEASGVRVNLYICDISRSSRTSQSVGWLLRVKASGQHLDVFKTAYALTNPSMLRRHSFRFTEVSPNVSSAFVRGYGVADDNIEDLLTECGLKNAKVLTFRAMRYKNIDEISKMMLG